MRVLAELKTWGLSEVRDGSVFLLTMTGPKAHAISPGYNQDGLELVHGIKTGKFGKLKPVVLSGGEESIFSAGIDLLDVMKQPSRQASRAFMTDLLTGFSQLTLEFMSLPIPTCAAINGHALAGGAVISSAADKMFGMKNQNSRFGAIETVVGIPFPPFARLAIMRHLPLPIVTDGLLFGKTFTHDEAFENKWLHGLADTKDELVEKACDCVTQLPPACYPAYGKTKIDLIQPILDYCHHHNARVLEESMDICFSDEGYPHLTQFVKAIGQKK